VSVKLYLKNGCYHGIGPLLKEAGETLGIGKRAAIDLHRKTVADDEYNRSFHKPWWTKGE
jgi:hypothetical protein